MIEIADTEGRPTVMVVDREAIRQNYRTVKTALPSTMVMAVLKANAYGHGLLPVARALEEADADYFGVALVEEGIELRQGGIKTPILVFGGIFGDQIAQYLSNNLELTASSIDKLRQIDATAKQLQIRARVHLKIDTGMGRIGVQYSNARALFEAALSCSDVEVVGVFSHLATADDKDRSYTELQLKRFAECVEVSKEVFGERKILHHVLNSAGICAFPDAKYQMVRAGLVLYGINPVPSMPLPLTPAMTLKSQVVYFKVLQAGSSVSYGRTWTAKTMTRVVTVPIGYGDGNFRRLSNCGSVLIRGKRYPIIGRVCMDQMMIDIGMDEAFNGDEVILLGKQGREEITVSELAKTMDTIEHDVLTSTNMRVPRVYP